MVDTNGRDKIEAIECQIGEFLVGKGFIIEMGLHEPDSAQKPASKAHLPQVGQREPPVGSHQDLVHHSTSGDHQADAASDFPGQGGATSRELRADDLIDRNSAAVQPLKPRELIRFQTVRIAVDG